MNQVKRVNGKDRMASDRFFDREKESRMTAEKGTFAATAWLIAIGTLTLAALSSAAVAGTHNEAKDTTMSTSTAVLDTNVIQPFRVDVPEEQLADLRRRILATNWPEKETVDDASQGVQLAMMQKLARYWATDYDWRKCEARLNSYPQFITEIDGLDIHFIHVRSKHENALPLIVTHGWPGSPIEQLKIIGPLTDPTAFGGRAEDDARLGPRSHGAGVGGADEAPRVQPIRGARR